MLEHSGTEDLSNSDYEQHTDTSSSDGNESDDETFADTFENYSPPDFKSYQEEEKTTIDNKFSWILLWIMTFRKKFNLPKTVTESQLKFMKIVLKEIGGDIYDSFPVGQKSIMTFILDIRDPILHVKTLESLVLAFFFNFTCKNLNKHFHNVL
ncbi:hypothetical protein RirG_164250 [Rhizophagus irregularis DAOM 197198w]|uniref:Uncharacterized protein n=1 Tax=Rhizophagus irregularis (strain DAOM 197198w) TaxID=1432141 RepID=A0A015M5U9_RHIIW|nr:hypothetical protein RirG_164250 [Rhizophagus irregularis DAOM 197198w]